jgi:anthranilate synthase component 2
VLAQVNDIPMAVYHEAHNMLGFQFHPESILTHQGSQLLAKSIEFLVAQRLLTQ